jgi:hypothetical protein
VSLVPVRRIPSPVEPPAPAERTGGASLDAVMSRTHPLIAAPAVAALAVAGLGGVLLAPPAAAASPPVLEEARTFTVPSPRATGYDIDVDGDLAVYTGRYQSGSAAGTGLVQVARAAEEPAEGWVVTDLPVPADARGYGVSVAVDEESGRAAVGALTTRQVVVYTQAGPDDWRVEQILTPPADPRVGATTGFGESIALDGDTLVVGAPNATVDGRANAGLAYLFDLAAGTARALVPDGSLVIGDAIAGQAVAVADGTIAVGAPQVRRALPFYGTATFRVGGVYVWDATDLDAGPSLTSQPVGEDARSIPPTTSGPAFGYGLAVVGDRLYVGSPREVNYTAEDPDDPLGGYNDSSVDEGTTTQGAVYVYDVSDAGAPAQVGGKLMPPAHTWTFGHGIDATGDALLASGYSSADQRVGQVYVLDPASVDPATPDDAGLGRQVVEPAQVLRGSDMQPGARFGGNTLGSGLAVAGQRAAVAGFPTGSVTGGKVYLFDAVSAATPEVSVPDVAITYGERAVVTATVTGGLPTSATVTVAGVEVPGVAIAGSTISVTLDAAAFPAGAHATTVTAVAADGTPLATGAGSLTVDPAATTTTLGAAGTAEPGRSLAATGAVATAHGTIPTGSVELLTGGAVVATAALGPDGRFVADVPGDAIGDEAFTLEARYAGDVNHAASAGMATIDVLQPLPPTAPVDPSGPVGQVAAPPADGSAATGSADADRPEVRTGGLAVTGPGTPALLGAVVASLAAGGAMLALRSRHGRKEAQR